jgi:hypothetical protein
VPDRFVLFLQVERGIDLVYGGGSIGLMGLVSHAVHTGGRHVIGYASTTTTPSPSPTHRHPSLHCLPTCWVLLWCSSLWVLCSLPVPAQQLSCAKNGSLRAAGGLGSNACQLEQGGQGNPCRLRSIFHRNGSHFSCTSRKASCFHACNGHHGHWGLSPAAASWGVLALLRFSLDYFLCSGYVCLDQNY